MQVDESACAGDLRQVRGPERHERNQKEHREVRRAPRESPRSGRLVFPLMLLVFVVAQLVVLLGLYEAPIWAAFVRWFAALPLT
jgi:hypothetical protein